MVLLRRKKRDVPRAGPYAPGWDVPAQFNFTRDVVEALGSDPTRPALTFVDEEGIVDRRTFHEVASDAARWAHLLRTRLDRGDRALIVLGKVPAWHGAMLGALKGGVVAVPCPEMLRARDLAFRARHSGARLIIADRSLELEIEEMLNQVGSVSVLYLDEALSELSRYMPVAPTEDTTAGETALILYTSGTTQEPKGVVHTHAYTWAKRMQATHWLDAHERDVVWCTAGTGWAKAIWNVLLGPWSHGAEVVVHQAAFDPEERLSLLQRLGVTILCQAPTEYRMMAKVDALGMVHLPRLRHLVSAGEPLNPEVIARFQDALGLTVHDGYGQTENSLLVANAPGTPIRPGSMGLPTPGHDVAVIDEAGHVCPHGVEGDIALIGRPPTLFTGYWDDPAQTDAVFRDGWYVTGDRAVRDEQGYLWFVGRADDVILSAAYRIGPFEVESALLEHPAVAESAVVGVPDADRGQIVKAFVVLREGHEPGDELASELQEHVKAVTAPYKYPRAVAFVESLPKTTSGKIRRSELREMDARGEIVAVVSVPVGPTPEMREQAEREALESARLEAETAALREAEETARREAAAERARAEAAAFAARREAEAAERARAEAEAAAQREAEEAAMREAETAERARAEAEAAARREAEEAARREAEEAERLRAEAEAAERARADAEAAAEREALAAAQREAEEAARREAEEAERARAEAEAAAQREAEEAVRREAEEAERARAEAEAAAQREAEETARREAEETARREAEEAERVRAEAEAAERARAEAEAAERARAEAEAAAQREAEEAARREAEDAERLRAEAEAAERARLEAEAASRREAEAAARREAREAELARLEADAAARREAEEAERVRLEAEAVEAERLRAEAEAEAFAAAEAAAAEASRTESRWEARRRRREEAEIAKQVALEAKQREKEEEEQRKRYAADARADAKRREAEEKELAKRRAEEERRRAAEEKVAAKKREEEERRRRIEEKVAEERRAEEERRRQKEEAKARRGGIGRIFRGTPDEFDEDDAPVEPISDIVDRLKRYSGSTEPDRQAAPDESEPPQD
jgi:acyl-coenzyme A synthetase/AMP-(fatty) acid ligase